jgi:ABC-type lipoprotein release transport system permease subunit
VGAFFAVRLLRSMLFGVTIFDPLSFIGAALVLVLTVLLAGLAPATRAASIQPMQALRTE